MKKKEIKAMAYKLIESGMRKSEVFSQLSGKGIKDSHLAHFIASYADPELCDKHEKLNNFAITLMFAQALFALIVGYGLGAQIGPSAKWITAALIGAIPLLFAWGFYKHFANAYNAYIVLTIVNLPKQFGAFTKSPIASLIGLTIGISIFVLIWYLRSKLFPDFGFVSPKKIKGEYVFSG